MTEFAPMDARAGQGAVSAGGIIFAYLGLTPIIEVAQRVTGLQKAQRQFLHQT